MSNSLVLVDDSPAVENLPSFEVVDRAIDIYLSCAYDSAPPKAVNDRVKQFRAAGDQWPSCAAFERDSANTPTRLALRLGNRVYPHMKLVIEDCATSLSFLFRADTHDRHITVPPGQTGEYSAFVKLMKQNQELASAIEAGWESGDVPTFKAYLKQDLLRRAEIPMDWTINHAR